MKRRGAGVVHTSLDNLMTTWSGSQRWWESSKDLGSFVCAAEEICKRALKKDEEKVRKPSWRKDGKNGKEDERKRGMMKDRDQ